MPAVASRDRLSRARIAGSRSTLRSCLAASGGVSDRLGAARARHECRKHWHPSSRGDSGRRQVGADMPSWLAKGVLWRAERPRGFAGATASLEDQHSARQGVTRCQAGTPKVEGPIAGVKYQVLVVSNEAGNIASIPDLRCQAVGMSVGEAIANVRQKGLLILQEFEPAAFGPPQPSLLRLSSVELQVPSARLGTVARSTKHALQSTLYVLVAQQWVRTLTGPYDWENWPLAPYVFSEMFLRNLEHQDNLEEVAWICAMIACGLPSEFRELMQRARSNRLSGTQLTRDDGAKGWRCTLTPEIGAGAQLDFWTTLSGVIEFDAFTRLSLVRVSQRHVAQEEN